MPIRHSRLAHDGGLNSIRPTPELALTSARDTIMSYYKSYNQVCPPGSDPVVICRIWGHSAGVYSTDYPGVAYLRFHVTTPPHSMENPQVWNATLPVGYDYFKPFPQAYSIHELVRLHRRTTTQRERKPTTS